MHYASTIGKRWDTLSYLQSFEGSMRLELIEIEIDNDVSEAGGQVQVGQKSLSPAVGNKSWFSNQSSAVPSAASCREAAVRM